MKKQIFYFTATGNSLVIARQLQSSMPDYALHSIAGNGELAEEDCEKDIVIVTPIYMFNLPHIVLDFISRLAGTGKCSVILTGGGEAGRSYAALKKLFRSGAIGLKSIFNVPMPNNYTPFGYTDESEQSKRFKAFSIRLESISRLIASGDEHIDKSGTGFIETWLFPGVYYAMGHKYIRYLDKGYTSDSRCDGCGICLKVCPVDNISLVDEKPAWHQECQQCFACLQWCPKEAIQFKDKTDGIRRYRHPDITLNDIIESNNRGESKK